MWHNNNIRRPAIRPGVRSARRKRPRHGAVVLELILTLPIWLIFLLAVIEFGQLFAGRQQVALASRVGAEEASQTAALPLTDGDPVPADVLQSVNQQLASSGLSYCGVLLEHNVVPPDPPGPPVPVRLRFGTCDCPLPSTPFPPARQYVRVTVYTRMTQVTPNLLRTLGFDVSDRVIHHTTTFRHEL